MREELQRQYDWVAVRERLPADRGDLFLGFAPAEQEHPGWRRVALEVLPEAPGRRLRRTVWEGVDTRDIRVQADVIECTSADGALDALGDRLEYNQLAQLDPGPAGLGYVSFVHPAGAPPAAFFVRGNLCTMVASIGRRAVEILTWASRLDSNLADRPAISREGVILRPRNGGARTGTPLPVELEIPLDFQPDLVKVFAEGARLAQSEVTDRPRSFLLTPSGPGEVRVQAFALAAGKEAVSGSLVLEAD